MQQDNKLIANMRGLILDAVTNAKSGHSGMAIGSAEIIQTLFSKYLNFTNLEPKWFNRDRFVLSAGHSVLSIYSILHFMGVIDLEDIKKFRTEASITPGHPEHEKLQYLDASTGPLGQGVAMGVGMAIAQKYLANKFNKNEFKMIDHKVYVLTGDGCLQEGVALEALQLAGTMQLDNFILLHDANNVQLDTHTKMVNNIDFEMYFKSMNFNVFSIDSSVENIENVFEKVKNISGPTYIKINTEIAKFTPAQNNVKGHASIFTDEQNKEIKLKMNLTKTDKFVYENDSYNYAQSFWDQKNQKYNHWNELFKKYEQYYPNEANELKKLIKNDFKYDLKDITFTSNNLSTRDYTLQILNHIENKYWSVIGGSADVSSSTKVKFSKNIDQNGQNILYGVREHAMTAINNGINLSTNLKTLSSTFLAFSDYAKGALRLGAYSKIPAINIYSHDSYLIGTDGPTHQPFEQLAMLRAMQNMLVIRPCDQFELLSAFEYALNQKQQQISIITTRQNIKSYDISFFNHNLKSIRMVKTFVKENNKKWINILASGSEVMLAEKAAQKLVNDYTINVNLYSVPVLQWLVNDEKTIKNFLIDKYPILAIEASSDSMWYRLGKYNKFDAILATNFGESAKGEIVYAKNGFNIENIIEKSRELVK
ncbi:transketolase [Mycoplasma sp. CSL7475-4]|uniref:transketolase-like TK C-terminal-containing protein n=1 Tax=Mycoplasma sp. CSL7475-4 TaxID=2973942 RepID=UPI00216B3E11|nr:1-deoxy-D-xylulose-5-phosphate synthase N-terminal domain-containing protein [Mycoplasma sp. CSL7475-4]MCS4537113.1 transketolase [Mycoplasma sp. CSL7475-4]